MKTELEGDVDYGCGAPRIVERTEVLGSKLAGPVGASTARAHFLHELTAGLPQALASGNQLSIHADDYPRSLRDPMVRARRAALAESPHMRALVEFASNLRRPDLEVPEFDPLDGGVRARMLFLLEKPGPMTSAGSVGRRTGSGFISRNNDDPSAEATYTFMNQAGIPRGVTVTWNVVPGWNGTRKISSPELRAGVSRVKDLIALLPDLEVIVLVGRKAGRARRLLQDMPYQLFQSDHPSPLVRARWPERWAAIPNVWADAYACLQA